MAAEGKIVNSPPTSKPGHFHELKSTVFAMRAPGELAGSKIYVTNQVLEPKGVPFVVVSAMPNGTLPLTSIAKRNLSRLGIP